MSGIKVYSSKQAQWNSPILESAPKPEGEKIATTNEGAGPRLGGVEKSNHLVPKVERLKSELRDDIVGGLARRAPMHPAMSNEQTGRSSRGKTSWSAYFFSYHPL
jgi:hypothetical protein